MNATLGIGEMERDKFREDSDFIDLEEYGTASNIRNKKNKPYVKHTKPGISFVDKSHSLERNIKGDDTIYADDYILFHNQNFNRRNTVPINNIDLSYLTHTTHLQVIL